MQHSIDRNTLWLLLLSIGLPSKIVELMKAHYTDIVSCVKMDGDVSDWFEIKSDVSQGCTLAPNLLLPPMDCILERTVHKSTLGTTIGSETFSDLDYADDVALLAEIFEILLLSLDIMQQESGPFGQTETNKKYGLSTWPHH